MGDEFIIPVRVKQKEELVSLGEGAVIDDGVLLGYVPGRNSGHELTIGPGSVIRSGSVIYLGSHIGSNLETGHGVVIREDNSIGNDFCIWNNSVVDYGCKIGNKVKIHTRVYVCQFSILEDQVFLGPGVVLTNDIHPGCPDALECMQGPTIKKGAQIGANSSILPRVVIGEHSVIGAGSVVTKNIPAGVVAFGNPAKVVGKIEDLVCTTGLRDTPYNGLFKPQQECK